MGVAEAEVNDFLRALVVPGRPREPRRAHRLDAVDQHSIPSPAGAVAAWRVGDGPAVLLIHGWQDDTSLWDPLIDALVARGRALVAFDLPGHGFSEGEWGLTAEAADGALAVADALGPIDATVAHSFGAGAQMFAYSEGLAVERMVMIAPPFGTRNRWLVHAGRMGVSDDVALAAQAIYHEKIGPRRAGYVFRDEITGFDTDLLIIHSSDDERFDVNDSAEVGGQCRRAELVVVEGLSHRRTARDPGVVARITDFLTVH